MILSNVLFEVYNKDVAAARRKEREAEQALLLQVQLMSFQTIIKNVLELVPTAKWMQFKNSENYKGKIIYEAQDGYAELWFRNDGMVVCSCSSDGRKSKCDSDEKIFAWVKQHPAIDSSQDVDITPDMIPEITEKIFRVFDAAPLKKCKNQTKVIGSQNVGFKTIGYSFDIWYRPSGEVFCKTPDGKFYTFNKLQQFERFLKANCRRRNEN